MLAQNRVDPALTKGRWLLLLLLCRLSYILCSLTAVVVISVSSSEGQSVLSGYYCLFGSQHLCDLVLATAIILFVSGAFPLIVQVLWPMRFGRFLLKLALYEVVLTVLTLVSFILQVALKRSSGRDAIDAVRDTGMAFTFLTFALGVGNCVLMYRLVGVHFPEHQKNSLMGYFQRRVSSSLETILFGLSMVFSIISLTIVGSFGIESGVVPNTTCLFDIETQPDTVCNVVRVTCVLALSIVPLLLVEVRVRTWLGKKRKVRVPLAVDCLRMIALLALTIMQFTAFSLTARIWSLILNSREEPLLNGGERHGGAAVIALLFFSTAAFLGIFVKWSWQLRAIALEADKGIARSIGVPGDATAPDEDNRSNEWQWQLLVPEGRPLRIILFDGGMVLFSIIALATLTSANYDGAESLENLNSSCVYAENESECNFVIATAALSLVYHVLVILTNCGWCCRLCTERQCPTILSIGVEYAMPGVVFIMWLSSASLQAHNKTHSDRVYYNEADLNAAIVFSFFATALVLSKIVVSMVLHRSDPKVQFEARVGNWRLICLILLVISSLLSLILSAQHAYWPDTAGELSGQCIFGSSAPACTTLVASYSISLAVTCGLLIVSVLKIRHPVHPLAATILSVPCMLLAWLLVFLVNIEWHWSISNLNVAPSSAMQYNSGYTLAANSVFSALLWSLLVFLWIRFALDSFNFSTLFRVRPIKVTAGDVPADSGSDDDADGLTNHGDERAALCGVSQPEDGVVTPAGGQFLRRGVWPQAMTHQCPIMKDCWKFVVENLQLDGLRDVFDHRYDRCYCEQCRDTTIVAQRGEEVYVLPEDWCRFGLNPRAMIEQYGGDTTVVDRIFDKREGWPVGFHGTFTPHVRNILKEGRLLKPNEKTKSGTVIKPCDGHFDAIKQPSPTQYFDFERIFFSQSVRYCECYCRQENPPSTHLCVLQARIQRGKYDTGPETLGGDVEERYIGRSEMEWSVKKGKYAPLYGLLIRTA